MKKSLVSLALVLALIISVCCVPGMAAPLAHAEPSPEVSATPAMAEKAQKKLLMAEYDLWAFKDEDCGYSWYYSFTDLDHNGRMEVVTCTTQGSGVFTTAFIWELSEDYGELEKCSDFTEDNGSFPEICVDKADCYFDSESGRYWYVFEDLTKNGYAEQYYSICALSLSEGHVDCRTLAAKEIIFTDPEKDPEVSCLDEDGNEISEQEYDEVIEKTFEGFEQSEASFDWTCVEVVPPTPEPTPTSTPKPQVYTGPPPAVTKNPSSESLSVGGKTWFIAHASNADSITWLFTSPQGITYDMNDTMRLNPGLYLEMLPQDTIAVSNVPASFNGWAVLARFDGPGGSVTTSPAYISVSNYESAYANVIDTYRYLYASGMSGASYAYQYGVSPMISYSPPSYALKDLNKDGIPELIIAAAYPDDFTYNVIFGLYTLVNGAPIKLCESSERQRWYLLTDNRVMMEGSSGAASQVYELYTVGGGSLRFSEGFASYNSTDSSGTMFYHSTIPSPYGGGNYDIYDAAAPREVAMSYIAPVQAKKWLPQLKTMFW